MESKGFIGTRLTEELLVKFGFEKIKADDEDDCYWYELLIPNKYQLKMYWDKEEGITIEDYPIKCDYVHQLQNLYFALTQTEL